MINMITSKYNIFQVVKENIDLMEAIEYYGFQPIRKGRYYWLLCPFHSEKHPSFCINGNTFKCFGCGVHGDVINFVSLLFNLKPIDAVYRLVTDFGIDLPYAKKIDKIYCKAKQNYEDIKLYQAFITQRDRIYDYLCNIRDIYSRLKELITNPEDIQLDEFVETCHKQDLIEYWLDIILTGSIQEQYEVIKSVIKEVTNDGK